MVISVPGVLGNDTDVDGDTLTSAVATGPSNGSLTLNSDGSFSYAPTADFHGSDSFTYTVSVTKRPVAVEREAAIRRSGGNC